MTYSKNGKFISIEVNDLLGGKKPGLYVGEGNQLVKVGTFSTYAKASLFEEFLRYFFGKNLREDDN